MPESYTINLKKVKMSPRNKRAGRAVNILKEFLDKHLDSDYRISKRINEKIWENGARNPPKTIEIKVTEEDGNYWVDLPGKKPEKKEEKEETKVEEEKEVEKKEKEEEKIDLPEEVKETLKDGTIGEGKEVLKGINKSEFEKALNFEEKHQNRKGMKKFIESNMR